MHVFIDVFPYSSEIKGIFISRKVVSIYITLIIFMKKKSSKLKNPALQPGMKLVNPTVIHV